MYKYKYFAKKSLYIMLINLHMYLIKYLPVKLMSSVILVVSPLFSDTMHVYVPVCDDLTLFNCSVAVVMISMVTTEFGAAGTRPSGPSHVIVLGGEREELMRVTIQVRLVSEPTSAEPLGAVILTSPNAKNNNNNNSIFLYITYRKWVW